MFSNVEVETRFLEEPGLLDLVYKIKEGEQYRVRNINIRIEGNSGTTRREVALNRIGLQPGDVIDLREIRNSERRLGSSEVFEATARMAVVPDELRAAQRRAGSGSRSRPRSRPSRPSAGSGSSGGGGSGFR